MENIKTNKRRDFIILSIAFMLILMMGSAYAFFTYSKIGSNSYAINLRNASLIINYTQGTRVMNLNSAYPLSDGYATSNLDKLSYIDFAVSGKPVSDGTNMNYEIYLTENENNTLNTDYVKLYLTDEEGNVIVEPTLYSSLNATSCEKSPNGKVLYSGLETSEFSKNYRLYMWIDSNYSQNDVSQTFGFKVNLYAYSGTTDLVYENLNSDINDSTCKPTKVGEDGTIYLTGTNSCVDFNYVNYSNNLWRVVAINPDKSLKLVTEEPVTTYSGETSTTKENVYDYLNTEFSNTLNNRQRMLTATNTNEEVTLLTTKEYNEIKGEEATESYINTDNDWLLASDNSTATVNSTGEVIDNSENVGIRPSINLKSESRIVSGDGTKANPYQIAS